MKKVAILGLGVMIAIFSIGLVVAGAPNFVSVEVITSNGHASVVVPENAVEVAPGVFSFGTTIDFSGGHS